MATKQQDNDGPTRDDQVAAVRADFSDDERNVLIDTWVESVKVGRMTRANFEEAAKNAVEAGLLNSDEVDRGRAALD